MSGKKIACTFYSMPSSREGFKRLTLEGYISSFHLLGIVYIQSPNLLLVLPLIYYPSLHPASPMLECGIVDTLPAGGGLFILPKGKRKHLYVVVSPAF